MNAIVHMVKNIPLYSILCPVHIEVRTLDGWSIEPTGKLTALNCADCDYAKQPCSTIGAAPKTVRP